MESIRGDVRDADAIAKALAGCEPEVVIHMAAQPMVRRSFAEPRATYETNVMGTVNLLEAVRLNEGVRVVVNVTSDKCYENREWEWGYRENEPMGGHDPYSSSKGAAELVTSAYRRSFFSDPDGPRLGSAQGGQRDRRRRLGRGSPGARRDAGGPGERDGAGAQPQLDPSLAARGQSAQRLPGAGPGDLGVAGARLRLELRARRGRGTPRRLADRTPRGALAGAGSLDRRRRATPARGQLPEARLLAGALAPRMATAGLAGDGPHRDRRLVPRARGGRRHEAGDACASSSSLAASPPPPRLAPARRLRSTPSPWARRRAPSR